MKASLSTTMALLILAAPLRSQAAPLKQADDYIVVVPDSEHSKVIPYVADMTLLAAVNARGGFNEFSLSRIVLVRCGKKRVVDVKRLRQDPSKDCALEPWDTVYFPQAMF